MPWPPHRTATRAQDEGVNRSAGFRSDVGAERGTDGLGVREDVQTEPPRGTGGGRDTREESGRWCALREAQGRSARRRRGCCSASLCLDRVTAGFREN